MNASSESQPPDRRPDRTPAPNLALVRTDLANERTLLAYGRTALMLAGTGVSLVKFLDSSIDMVLVGWGLIAAGLIVGGMGVKRIAGLRERLHPAAESDS